MKNSIIYLLFILSLIVSCVKVDDNRVLVTDTSWSDVVITKSRIRQDAVWNDDLQLYLYPYEDIYKLTLFQDAYDRVSNGTSVTHVSSEERAKFTPGIKLKPTHRALHVKSRSVSEQSALERNEHITVRYIPFGYEGFNSPDTYLPDISDDSIVDECKIEDRNAGDVRIADLYVYWPISLAIPDSLDYNEVYSVFIPEQSNDYGNSLSSDCRGILMKEVLAYRGLSTEENHARDGWDSVLCCLYVRDTLLHEYVPVPGAKIVIQPGIIQSGVTDDAGYFCIPRNLGNYKVVYAVLTTNNWSVCINSSTVPKSINIGTTASFYNSPAEVKGVRLSSTPELAVHRAAYSYYNDSHHLSCWNPLSYDPIRISVSDALSDAGQFDCYANPPYILIKPKPEHDQVFFTTLHEIGHYAHYSRLGRSTFNSRWGGSEWYKLLTESFASFAGWDSGRQYYIDNGYVPSYPYDNFTVQDRQKWIFTSSDRYSPFFVDIVDNYNQNTSNPSYLFDSLCNTTYGYQLIRQIIDNCYTFNSVSTWFHYYDSVFSSVEIDNYLDEYYYWEQHNYIIN